MEVDQESELEKTGGQREHLYRIALHYICKARLSGRVRKEVGRASS